MAGGYFDAVPIQSGATWTKMRLATTPIAPDPRLVDRLNQLERRVEELECGAKKKRSKQAGKAAAAKKQEKRKLKTSSVTKGKKR